MGGIITYKAECVVKYRYTCEKCTNAIEWQEGKVWMIAQNIKSSNWRRFEYNVERTVGELEKTAKDAVDNLEKLTEALKAVLEKEGKCFIPDDPFLVEKYNEIFFGGAVCAICSTRQSWYPAFAFIPNKFETAKKYAISTLAACGVVGIFVAAWSVSYDTGVSGTLSPYLLIAPFVLVTISAIVGFFKANRLIKHLESPQKGSFLPRKPEVVWDEPTVEVVGCPTEEEKEIN